MIDRALTAPDLSKLFRCRAWRFFRHTKAGRISSFRIGSGVRFAERGSRIGSERCSVRIKWRPPQPPSGRPPRPQPALRGLQAT